MRKAYNDLIQKMNDGDRKIVQDQMDEILLEISPELRNLVDSMFSTNK